METECKNEWAERLIKSSEALDKAYDSLDVNEEDYYDNLKTVSAFHERVATDFNNYVTINNEKEKLAVEEKKGDDEKKISIIGHVLSAISIVAGVVTFLADEKGRDRRFDMAHTFEETNAYLKSSDKLAVREGLEEPRRNFFNLFKR